MCISVCIERRENTARCRNEGTDEFRFRTAGRGKEGEVDRVVWMTIGSLPMRREEFEV